LISKYKTTTETKHHSVTNVYFEAKVAPQKGSCYFECFRERKIVNNLTVMTNVSTAYAPAGKVLISVSCNGLFDFSDLELAQKIKTELQPWFGNQVEIGHILKLKSKVRILSSLF
jgi:hypothetical protein